MASTSSVSLSIPRSLSMASPSVSFSLPRLRFSHPSEPRCLRLPLPLLSLPSPSRVRSPLRASRRLSGYPQEALDMVPDPRAWVGEGRDDDEEEEEEEEEEEDDRSLDLLVRFLGNIFRKISRRARRAVRPVLPPSIPTKLVGFSVNGVLILAFLWILKAFLEVVCTFGSMVFASILFVRGVWSGVSYMRENQYSFMNRIDNDDSRWSGAQAAT